MKRGASGNCETVEQFEFWCKVLITTYICAFAGLNLHKACHNMMPLKSAKNYNTELQAIDCVHWIDQKHQQKSWILCQNHIYNRTHHHNNTRILMQQTLRRMPQRLSSWLSLRFMPPELSSTRHVVWRRTAEAKRIEARRHHGDQTGLDSDSCFAWCVNLKSYFYSFKSMNIYRHRILRMIIYIGYEKTTLAASSRLSRNLSFRFMSIHI